MSKKMWLNWHSWLGLKLSLLMLVICITGTIAVVSHEIDWLLDSDLRLEKTAQGINWDAMAGNIKKRYPQRQITYINRPMYGNAASIARTIDPFLGARRVYLNPYSGEIIAEKAWYASVQRVIRDLHRYLLSPIAGIYLVGPFGIILLASLITALVCYKKWWRGFFKLRINNGSRAFFGSLHKVAGLWSLWFVALIAITGVWYLLEAAMRDVGIEFQFNEATIQVPQVTDRKLIERQFIEKQLPPSYVIKKAKAQFEHFTVATVVFPKDQETPYYINGFTNAPLVRARSNEVDIDAISGEVLWLRKTHQQGAYEIWIDLADPLHFGDFAGLWTKIIWFIFGLILCALCAIGIVIFLKRIKNRGTELGLTTKLWGKTRFVMYGVLLIPILSGGYLFAEVNDWLPRAQFVKSHAINIDESPALLLLGKRDDYFYLGVFLECQCLMLPTELSLLLKNGSSIPFQSNKLGFFGKSARLLPEQVKDMAYLEWRQNKKLRLRKYIGAVDFEH
ncbi:MAG: PepSY domain-containing protein [Colwellia sp.]|nr:PepSY domain-containing protein [Colwellia sp.]